MTEASEAKEKTDQKFSFDNNTFLTDTKVSSQTATQKSSQNLSFE